MVRHGTARGRRLLGAALLVAAAAGFTAPAQAATVDLRASADATLDQRSPSTSFGAALTLQGADKDKQRFRWALMRFDLSGVTGTVQSASLTMTIVGQQRKGAWDFLAPSSDSWAEDAVTWATQPAIGFTMTEAFAAAGARTVTVPVPPSAITLGTTNSFALTSSATSTWRSREAGVATAPVLTITTS
jgi:hyaluronate lyase